MIHNFIPVLFGAKKINVLDAERYEVSKNKGYVGFLCLAKLVLHQKLTKNEILPGLNLSRFNSKSNKPTSKVSQNHWAVLNSNEAYFHQKTPTHISATYAITNCYQNL